MNKVITINLGGNAYQLEEGGYDVLRAYLETAAARLKNNPDRDEILLDIERAIAEKFRALLASHKNVVEAKEVNAVIAEMGPVETEGSAPSSGQAASGAGSAGHAGGTKAAGEERSGASGGLPKRLYRITEGGMLAGVCNGLGAYFNLDPTFIRLAFAFLAIVWGTGILVYIVLAFVIPEAVTPEEKAAATGSPATAQEFIRRAKEGYYEAVKGFPDSRTRREWTRRWKREIRMHSYQWRYNWQNYWKTPAPVHPAMGFTLPILSVLQGAATVIWICALISLLATGMVFGLALPASVPVWAAALVLFILYGLVVGPMKAARRAYYWSAGQSRWAFPFIALVDTVVWMVVTVILLALAIHYLPELRQAMQSLPALANQAITDLKTWWHSK
jgi:phage shock protein PspC (stress-responsive transcriptional regulator)